MIGFGRSKKEGGQTSYAKGVHAEQSVAEFLERGAYKIVERRYKTKFGEIDLIAEKDNILCFVEVKARPSVEEALHSVTAKSRKRIEQSALFFISKNEQYCAYDLRFDVVAITKGGEITHLDNAWFAGDNSF